MSRKILFFIAVSVFGMLTSYFILKNQNKHQKYETGDFPILQRKGAVAQRTEWSTVQQKVSNLAKQIKKQPADLKSLLALTSIYLNEARISGNYPYYNAAAMHCVNRVLNEEPDNFQGCTFKSMILLSNHHFNEGLAEAEKAKKINPYNSFVYGLLVDANIETGNYEAAVENADKMVSIRPDIRSYSRIAYLREIHGDVHGAIRAMKMAVDAGPPGDEGTEWSRIQLGKLFEQTGESDSARIQYEISLQYRPDYPYALAGLGRIACINGQLQKALSYYKKADASISDISIRNEIGEVYLRMGQKDSSDIVFRAALKELTEFHHQSGNDDDHEHYADLELAYAWLRVNNYEEALEHALIEFKRRPGNIDVNEALAWVYYRRGDYRKAVSHIKVALKTNCKNPVLLSRAALIFAKNDDPARGLKYFREAMRNNPNIPLSLKEETAKVFPKN